MDFEKISDKIYQLKIPYYNIYTSVFLIRDGDRDILFDCGDGARDVEQYLLPALQKLGAKPSILVLSHSHQDHAGGADALQNAFPSLEIKSADPLRLKESKCKADKLDIEKKLSPHVKVVPLAGHGADCVGLYDTQDKILLSADALQQWGVGKWGTCIAYPKEYQRSLDRVAGLRAKVIVASHDYEPLGAVAEGNEEIEMMLSECQETYYDIEDMIFDHPDKSVEELVSLYAAIYPDRPPLAKVTVERIINRK